MNTDCFSVDIGEKFTRIVDTSYAKNKITVHAAGVQNTVSDFYTDDTEKSISSQAEIISKMYSDLKLTKRTVNIVLPDSHTYSQILNLALLNEKELLSAVRYQADQFIPIPIDDVVLDIEVLSINKEKKQNTILVIACPKKIVERSEKVFEMLSILPITLENELSSIGRIFRDILKFKSDNSFLVINMGYSSSSFYLIDGRTSLILMTHTIKLGLELFIKELKFNLEGTETKSLELLKSIGFDENASYDIAGMTTSILREYINELSKFVISAKERFNLHVEKMYLFNHANHVLSFDKKIQELLQIPVEILALGDFTEKNAITNSLGKDITSFIGSIAGNLR